MNFKWLMATFIFVSGTFTFHLHNWGLDIRLTAVFYNYYNIYYHYLTKRATKKSLIKINNDKMLLISLKYMQ